MVAVFGVGQAQRWIKGRVHQRRARGVAAAGVEDGVVQEEAGGVGVEPGAKHGVEF